MTCISPWYDSHGCLGVHYPQRLLQCCLSDLACLWFTIDQVYGSMTYDSPCYDRHQQWIKDDSRSGVLANQLPVIDHVMTCLSSWYDLLGYQLVKKKSFTTEISTDVWARFCQLWAMRVCTETKLDEACRWLPRPEHAESRKQRKPSPTHDSRHLPSLSGALDVSGAEL